jgi:uncharacterized protein (TIGR00290 family)
MKACEPILFCWSGGKDSALALHRILQSAKYDVKYLLTTLSKEYQRISMHGVREQLLEMQAKSIGIELIKVFVSSGSNEEYEQKMKDTLFQLKKAGVEKVAFGDIFLEDLRVYREKMLEQVGMKAVFPLWKENTKNLAEDFVRSGFKAITCCVNDGFLKEPYLGNELDTRFFNSLPKDVDMCGENGEYHSFVYDGPFFKNTLKIKTGEKIYKPLEIKFADNNSATKGFWYIDILPDL